MKFIWKIIKFSSIKSGIIQSPSFLWNATTWEVKIHLTNATMDSDYFSVELHQIEVACLAAYCSFAFLDSQGFPFVWKENAITFTRSKKILTDSVIFPNFIKKEEILGSRRNEFLPNDILTVECHIWLNPSYQFIENVPLMAQTQIEPFLKKTKKSFIWVVADASLCHDQDQALLHVESMTINGKRLLMKLLLVCTVVGEWNLITTLSLCPIHLKLTISVLDTSMKKKQLVEEEFTFEKNGQEWHLGTRLSRNMLQCYKKAYLCNDTLSLHFSFSCTKPGIVTSNRLLDEDELVNIVLPNIDAHHISEHDECADEPENDTSNTFNHVDTLSKAIEDLYKEGFLSDFDLRVGERLFPVHKNILGMRSPVFRAMFASEMKEKEDNCSVIEDVDGDTLQRMLQFIYSDKMEEDIDWECASSLYEAADKYALETLKHKCSDFLGSVLCAASVLYVLKLADMHHDEELKSSAFEFILLNDKEIVCSEQWNRFEEENKQLASDTFRRLYLHFKNMI